MDYTGLPSLGTQQQRLLQLIYSIGCHKVHCFEMALQVAPELQDQAEEHCLARAVILISILSDPAPWMSWCYNSTPAPQARGKLNSVIESWRRWLGGTDDPACRKLEPLYRLLHDPLLVCNNARFVAQLCLGANANRMTPPCLWRPKVSGRRRRYDPQQVELLADGVSLHTTARQQAMDLTILRHEYAGTYATVKSMLLDVLLIDSIQELVTEYAEVALVRVWQSMTDTTGEEGKSEGTAVTLEMHLKSLNDCWDQLTRLQTANDGLAVQNAKSRMELGRLQDVNVQLQRTVNKLQTAYNRVEHNPVYLLLTGGIVGATLALCAILCKRT